MFNATRPTGRGSRWRPWCRIQRIRSMRTDPGHRAARRSAVRIIGHLIAPALLFLAACSNRPPELAEFGPADRQVFAEAYQDITDYHLIASSPAALTESGLGKLATLDTTVAVTRSGDELLVRQGTTTDRFHAPSPLDARGWGDVTATVLDRLRTLSPGIAVVPKDRLTELVINGALADLDPFSHYARPAVAKQRRAQRYGFGGIGVTVDVRRTGAIISAVLPDTPAAAAGIQSGDRLIAIDGVPVVNIAAAEIDDRLRGEIGTQIMLVLSRTTEPQQISLTLTRSTIVEPTASLALRGDIAWLRITAFNQKTAQNVAVLLRQAHREASNNLHGIVLDLRSDPGGLLEQSVDVARLFLDGGMVVRTLGRHPDSLQSFDAPPNEDTERLPLAVLINGGTASASEIVAAALQDAGRAIIIGTASYGKGTVQNVLDLSNKSELTVTWAQLVPPRGYQLHHHGVVPTLCTSGLTDDATSAAALLQRRPSPVPAALAQPREDLDEAGWQSLRSLCPAEHMAPSVDIEVARQLFDDPPLYRRTLAAMSPSIAHHNEARAP